MFITQLRHGFSAHASRTAVEFETTRYRFSDLEMAADRIGAVLQAKGIEPGDRLALLIESKELFLLTYLGTLWCGAVPIPLNPGFKVPEVTYFVRDSGAALLVHDASSEAVARPVSQSCACLRGTVAARDLTTTSPPGAIRSFDPQPEDPALMLYSSGTTGEPKGVVHTQSNLLSSVRSIIDAWRFSPDDLLAHVLPLFHIHGLSFAAHVSLLAGSCMLIEDSFHPTRTLDLIDRATVFMAVPPYYYAFLKRVEFRERAVGWQRLRLATCGSAPIRPEVLPELEGILKRPVINRYGMTECHVLTSLPLGGPWPQGSVGPSLSGVEICVRTDSGSRSAVDEVGRVWARGPNLFREYWRRPEATRESFDENGWFDTGDLGRLESRGYLTLVGRNKDLIIVGGFNVYPAVVERVLGECPGVREVAVVGIPDAARGERVAAFIVPDTPHLDTKLVRAFCRDRLVDYQCPSCIELVDELPRNAMGKVLKRELRQRRQAP